MIESITPVLYVDAIEPVLPFWVDRLGFEVVAEVPERDRLGFVILSRDGVQVMYQTRASVASDLPQLADAIPTGGALLYVTVADLDAVDRALAGVDRVVARRKTFYGADEFGVREPGGNHILFARMSA